MICCCCWFLLPLSLSSLLCRSFCLVSFAFHAIFLSILGQYKCVQARSAKECCFESFSMARSGLHSFERSYSSEQVDETTKWTWDDGPSTLGEWKTISVESTGVAFAGPLMDRKASGPLSAKEVWLLSFFGKHAGLTGFACECAFHPESASTGHYQRHLDKVNSHKRILTFITQVNSNNVFMWETQHNNVDCDYFKILILPVTQNIRHQHRAESCIFGRHVRAIKLDVQETDFSFS